MECELLEWGEWSQCSRTCGGGRQVRVRSFTIPPVGDTVFCDESLSEIRDCGTDNCPGNKHNNIISTLHVIQIM